MCEHESKDFEIIRCKCGMPRKVFAGVGGLDEIRQYLEAGCRVTVDFEWPIPPQQAARVTDLVRAILEMIDETGEQTHHCVLLDLRRMADEISPPAATA